MPRQREHQTDGVLVVIATGKADDVRVGLTLRDGVPGTHYLTAEQPLQPFAERMTDRLLALYAELG